MKRKILNRIYAWQAFFRGDIAFVQAILIMLPQRMRPKMDRKVRLFGKSAIVPMDPEDFVVGFHQIVLKNQYHVELVRDNATVIDAGANVGIFSIFAAVKHPNATIYAFEPAPDCFAALRENTQDYPNIKVFNSGLGDVVETRDLVVSPVGMGVSHFDGVVLGGEYIVPARLTTVDNLNMRVDFMKMDTEGYEANVLGGAAETIRRWNPVIAMSAYHKPEDKTELPRILKGICPDYICELHYDDEEDFICWVPRQ